MSVPDVWGGLVLGSYLTATFTAWRNGRRHDRRPTAGDFGGLAFVFFLVWMFGRLAIAFATGT